MTEAPINDVLTAVEGIARGHRKVTVGDVMQGLGRASHAASLVLPAMIAATPLSGIPGLTTVCGLLIALIAAQALVGRAHFWLPGWMLRRKLDADDLLSALNKLRPVTDFLDRRARKRLRVFTRQPGVTCVRALCLICGLTMPFLEIIPFTGSLMAIVVLFLALSLLTKDGLFAAIGMAALALVSCFVLWVL